MSLQNLIFNAAPFAMIPAFLLAVISIGSGNNITIRILSFHIIFSTIIELTSTLLWLMKTNNFFLLHIYTLEEFTLITWFYSTLIRGQTWKLFFQICLVTFAIFTLSNSLFIQPLTVNNTYATGLESLICMVYALICFYKLINSSSTFPKSYLLGLLLINSGILIYFSSSSLFFTVSNYLRKPEMRDIRLMTWTIHAFFSIIYYLLLFFGLWIIRKEKSPTFYLQVP